MSLGSFLRIGLHGLLTVWMAAVAIAPLWHPDHAVPAIPEDTPAHEHGRAESMCDARMEIIDTAVDCVLCKAQRLLSGYWTRAPGAAVTVPDTALLPAFALFVPRAGIEAPLASRAPPLC